MRKHGVIAIELVSLLLAVCLVGCTPPATAVPTEIEPTSVPTDTPVPTEAKPAGQWEVAFQGEAEQPIRMAAFLDGLGEPRAGAVRYPGTVDGGDVVLMDGVAFVGLSRRTNAEGCRQLAGCLEKMGYALRPVPLPEAVLHLDKVLMPVDPDTLLVCQDVVDDGLLQGFATIGINFRSGATANVICRFRQ